MPSFIIAAPVIPAVSLVVSRCWSQSVGSKTNILNVIPLLEHGSATEFSHQWLFWRGKKKDGVHHLDPQVRI